MQNSKVETVMTEAAAAEFLGLSPRTLQVWRLSGRGPRFLKLGSCVRYRTSDLEIWLASCVRRSTSDDAGEE